MVLFLGFGETSIPFPTVAAPVYIPTVIERDPMGHPPPPVAASKYPPGACVCRGTLRINLGTSLEAPWLGLHLPVQGVLG